MSLISGLKPFSNVSFRDGKLMVTVDRQGRLCLGATVRRELGLSMTQSTQLYVSYDKVNKRIGIAKPDVIRLVDVVPFSFDGPRGYSMARNFLKANGISYEWASRYFYEGKENGWYVFKLSGYVAPDQPEESAP